MTIQHQGNFKHFLNIYKICCKIKIIKEDQMWDGKLFTNHFHQKFHTVCEREGSAINQFFHKAGRSSNHMVAMLTLSNSENEEKKEEALLSTLVPCPDTNKPYKFEDGVAWMPLKFNLGDVSFTKKQQVFSPLNVTTEGFFQYTLKTWGFVTS